MLGRMANRFIGIATTLLLLACSSAVGEPEDIVDSVGSDLGPGNDDGGDATPAVDPRVVDGAWCDGESCRLEIRDDGRVDCPPSFRDYSLE